MNRGIVAGNWKMHGSKQLIRDYVRALESAIADRPLTAGFILFPPVGYLQFVAAQLDERGLSSVVSLGAQNLHCEPDGAFTGEMAGEMLSDIGARWVLVGHSERRQFAFETNEQVADKFAAALRSGLSPMLCVGETEAEREAGSAEDIVSAQLQSVVSRCGADALEQAAIAYEPIWAIGTGKTATPQTAQEMHGFIRAELARQSAELAENVPLLYGGSVKSDNAAALFDEVDIDGGLVGGASLQAEELVTIARCLN
jgi:triosephosphate isomerase